MKSEQSITQGKTPKTPNEKTDPAANTATSEPTESGTIKPHRNDSSDRLETFLGRLSTRQKLLASLLLIITLSCIWFLLTAKTVVIQLSPNSEFTLSDRFHIRFDDHLLIRPGAIFVKATAKGYYPLEEEITVTGESEQQVNLAFKKLPGRLKIITVPKATGDVYINNKAYGRNDQIIYNVPAGLQQIEFKSTRYLPITKKLDIIGLDQEQSVTINLIPAWAELAINSSPNQANIYIDNKLVGKTPSTIEVLQGNRHIRIEKENFQTWSGQFNFVAGDNLELPTVELSKKSGQVSITSSPTDAGVTVNNIYQGQTPLDIKLPQGQHRIEIFKDGYQEANKIITSNKDSQHTVAFQLKPLLGDLLISATPQDALIYIDGRLMGRAGKTLQLPAKDYRLRIEHSDYVSQERNISIRAEASTKIAVTLLTQEQDAWKKIPSELSTSAGLLTLFKVNQTFTMGASRREQGRRANEAQRDIKLNRAFYLGTHEITNKQYRQYQRQHSSSHSKGISLNLDDQPVVNISWLDAARFCNWLSSKEGLEPVYQINDNKLISSDLTGTGYRLPTEAEWSWAARFESPGNMLRYPWGASLPPAANSGNFADRSGANQLGRIQADYNDGFPVSAPIGQFGQNTKGLFDMGGNVAEWVHDFYGIASGLSRKLEINPSGPETGDHHVIRGSSWRHGSRADLRLSFRDYGQNPRLDVGFRIAKYAQKDNKQEVHQ